MRAVNLCIHASPARWSDALLLSCCPGAPPALAQRTRLAYSKQHAATHFATVCPVVVGFIVRSISLCDLFHVVSFCIDIDCHTALRLSVVD